jgi:aerobic-type carbon monoxide dehydrogenase small subunit (CoxS/CutS family)
VTGSLGLDLTVNGTARSVTADVRVSLLDFLREELGLTGTHAGCEQGACGACSVLLDGEVVRSCLVLAVSCEGRSVTTIEALGDPGHIHPLQQAMLEHDGLQCGFCTPAMVLSGLDLLTRHPEPTEREVREALSGNLCRCTGYSGIVAAVLQAGSSRGKKEGP